MNIHEKYIKRCIELAKNGLGTTYPNPMVGSVIVYNDKIIGEGWHRKAGEPHAEVLAINSVEDKSLLKKSTIYISLEPCSHYGKTPPCANLIVENGLKKVVIGAVDLNSKVSGKGITHLMNHGCEVKVGVLEKECMQLNKRFYTFHTKKRPFILLKWAATKDGFIDAFRNENTKNSPNWISNPYSQQIAHKMRAEEQAILVGTNTALNDNPSLTTRSWFGKNPLRLVIDKSLKIPNNYKLYNGVTKTIFFTEIKVEENSTLEKVELVNIDFKESVPKQIMAILYEREIQSVIIEGGANTLQHFIEENLWDEAVVFVGDVFFKRGLKAPEIKKVPNEIREISNDTLKLYKNS